MVRVIVPVPYLGVQITRGLRVAIRIATDGGYEIGPFMDNDRANFADSEPSLGRSAVNRGFQGADDTEFPAMLIAMMPHGQ